MTTSTSRKRKNWAVSVGPYGCRVRIFEDAQSKIIYAETRDPTLKCGYRAISLRHRDREKAEQWAKQQVADLMAGNTALRDPKPTLARVFALYQQHQSPLKVPSEQQADRRRMRMWTKFLGAAKDLSKITLREWLSFISARKSGAIDASGNPVPEADPSDA